MLQVLAASRVSHRRGTGLLHRTCRVCSAFIPVHCMTAHQFTGYCVFFNYDFVILAPFGECALATFS